MVSSEIKAFIQFLRDNKVYLAEWREGPRMCDPDEARCIGEKKIEKLIELFLSR